MINVAPILGIIFALAGTIVAYVLVMPKSKDGNLGNKFLQFLHDFFHFKQLYVEYVLKFIYMLGTLFCIVTGFFWLFSYAALTGLMLMILGPVVLRLTYEFTMMFILLVQNTMDINKKLKGNKAAAPAEPVYRFCTGCGTRYDANATSVCPNCGKNND